MLHILNVDARDRIVSYCGSERRFRQHGNDTILYRIPEKLRLAHHEQRNVKDE